MHLEPGTPTFLVSKRKSRLSFLLTLAQCLAEGVQCRDRWAGNPDGALDYISHAFRNSQEASLARLLDPF